MALYRRVSKRFDGFDSSKQLAFGLAIGAMIGVLPKDNLLFGGLLVVLIISGANFITGALSGITAGLLSPSLESTMHQIGNWLLGTEFIYGPLAKFLQLPLAAWTRLDNTVVMGSFFAGVLAFAPIYLTSFFLFEKNRDLIKNRVLESSLTRWILGYESSEDRDD